MIWVLRPDQFNRSSGVGARDGGRYEDFAGFASGYEGKPVHVGFDGGRLT
jgi:hypothetical protein